jgi:hypothetical protein
MYLKKISEANIEYIQEIRLRAERPVVIVTPKGSSFLTNSGKLSFIFWVSAGVFTLLFSLLPAFEKKEKTLA